MYLKFIYEDGRVVRYNEVKKRIIIGFTRDFTRLEKRTFKITVNKHSIDVTNDIKLLHNILMTDFKGDYYNFQSVYNNANFFVSNHQLHSKNILVMFGSLYFDLKKRQFYNAPIIQGNVLIHNSAPVEPPFYYQTSISNPKWKKLLFKIARAFLLLFYIFYAILSTCANAHIKKSY